MKYYLSDLITFFLFIFINKTTFRKNLTEHLILQFIVFIYKHTACEVETISEQAEMYPITIVFRKSIVYSLCSLVTNAASDMRYLHQNVAYKTDRYTIFLPCRKQRIRGTNCDVIDASLMLTRCLTCVW